MGADASELRGIPDRAQRVRAVIGEVVEQRARNGSISDSQVLSQYPELLPELAAELKKLRCIDVALERIEDEKLRRMLDRLETDSSRTGSELSGDIHGDDSTKTDELPKQIGRYQIQDVLGQGGFGRVYLAWDADLARRVALKTPHQHRLLAPQDVEIFLTEARVVASLDHPGIVPVYDVGRMDDGSCYVVSKWIQGTNLATRIQSGRIPYHESALLISKVAESLSYAHSRGVIHRDIKPANILLDAQGNPHLADFGLALPAESSGKASCVIGTPAYMSPEQARGETHRIDGRSDIYSLAVVFYELLTGTRPRCGKLAVEFNERTSDELRPPRYYDAAIPEELERVCLKAMAHRAGDRYQLAAEFADDLCYFLQDEQKDGPRRPARVLVKPETARQPARRIIPKGLRAFDAHDADFFLDLLPGPCDRNGIPESIRQWRQRVESTIAEETFPVGLMYGPSGCGKSSLVRAGLLPRLASHVETIYLEAAVDETENRLRQRLSRKFPFLEDTSNLAACMAALRHHYGKSPDRKLLLVIDQFEQWLHGKGVEERRPLVEALRQCDGARLQCLLLVRDDFWLAISRFMDELEVELLQGHNTALVDLFDRQHAKRVLIEFGRAYSRLPDLPQELSPSQSAFIERALSGLSEEQDGKIISVRLALFAEMVKSRDWTPATLDELGGAEGVGVTFLEEMFCARSANPQHRVHEKAARAVLEALLPEPGSNIKGHVRSYPELLDISGYGNNPRAFKEVMRILDSETRLLTPTEHDTTPDVENPCLPKVRYYQLTHDYLVPSLRSWLTTKQKLTSSGRAELRLVERAKLWNARQERRQLPSVWEWLTIRLLTRPANWSPVQRRMMHVAAKHYATVAAALGVIMISFLVTGAEATTIAKSAIIRFRAETAPIWLAFGKEDAIWPLLAFEPDPTIRTRLIHNLSALLVDPEDLIESTLREKDVGIRRALILAAGEIGRETLATRAGVTSSRRTEVSPELAQQLSELLNLDVDPGIHAAAEWTLRQLDPDGQIPRSTLQIEPGRAPDRQWYVAAHGHTMVVIPGPVNCSVGSPQHEYGRMENEKLHSVHIRHSYSIADKETTVEQYQRFLQATTNHRHVGYPFMDPQTPQTMMSWYQAAAYCNWLSKEEGIPQSHWCYLPNESGEYAAGMKMAPNADELRGYRLPTEAEWEYACRAGTVTSRFSGDSVDYLHRYAIFWQPQQQTLAAVGSCKPNDFGLFDMLGNAAEWCQDRYTAEPEKGRPIADQITDSDERVVRGGSFLDPATRIRSAARSQARASDFVASVGFRVARNYP